MKENWVYWRGDIYLANLGVPIGSKQGGVRPVVVLQNDVGNFYSPTITVAPLTTKIQRKEASQHIISFGRQKGWQDLRWYWRSSLIHVIRPV